MVGACVENIILNIVCMLFCTSAKDFRVVQKKVAELIEGRILVGHALHNDFKVLLIQFFNFVVLWSWNQDFLCEFSFRQALLLTHPKENLRDTSEYLPFLKYWFPCWLHWDQFVILILWCVLTVCVAGEAGKAAENLSGTLHLSFLVLKSKTGSTVLWVLNLSCF